MSLLTLPYPERRDDIRAFCHHHHASRTSPGVWKMSYVITNARGRICGLTMIGNPPYPSVSRSFVREPSDIPRLSWQCRMTGAGISCSDLDELLAYSNRDLLDRGFYWLLTLTDPVMSVVDHAAWRLASPGYTGEVYHRNGFKFIGTTRKTQIGGWLIDGIPYHPRQGRITLTKSNVRDHFPNAREIRALEGTAKTRWVYILGQTPAERAERTLLMRYHVQPWENMTQPRLLTRLLDLLLQQKESTWQPPSDFAPSNNRSSISVPTCTSTS